MTSIRQLDINVILFLTGSASIIVPGSFTITFPCDSIWVFITQYLSVMPPAQHICNLLVMDPVLVNGWFAHYTQYHYRYRLSLLLTMQYSKRQTTLFLVGSFAYVMHITAILIKFIRGIWASPIEKMPPVNWIYKNSQVLNL